MKEREFSILMSKAKAQVKDILQERARIMEALAMFLAL